MENFLIEWLGYVLMFGLVVVAIVRHSFLSSETKRSVTSAMGAVGMVVTLGSIVCHESAS